MALERFDLVKVIASQDEETKEFTGALGIITDIDTHYEYPYELLFVGKKLNSKSEELGGLLWKENQLEAI